MPRHHFPPPGSYTYGSHVCPFLLVGRHGRFRPLVIRRCLKCQARKTSRQTIRWPILSLLLPNSPRITVSVDYFGPLSLTPRGNAYIPLFTDHFSRRADMFSVSAAQFTAAGAADIFIDKYITLWGCPVSLLSDNGLHFTSKLARAVYDLSLIHI